MHVYVILFHEIWDFYSLPNDSLGVLCFHIGCPCVSSHVIQVSVCLYFHFLIITCKYQWIFTKLGMCIDIVEVLFGIANGLISSIFDSLPATQKWQSITISPFYYLFYPGQDNKSHSVQDNRLHTCRELHTATKDHIPVARSDRPLHVPSNQTHTH